MPSRASTEHRYEKLTWPEINDAVKQLCRFVDYFQRRPRDVRHAEQRVRTMPIPWGQEDLPK